MIEQIVLKIKNKKSIEDIQSKQIDDFSKIIKDKAKRMKDGDTSSYVKSGAHMSQITAMVDKTQRLFGKYIDWEEIACEVMIRYYEQKEEMEKEIYQ